MPQGMFLAVHRFDGALGKAQRILCFGECTSLMGHNHREYLWESTLALVGVLMLVKYCHVLE